MQVDLNEEEAVKLIQLLNENIVNSGKTRTPKESDLIEKLLRARTEAIKIGAS